MLNYCQTLSGIVYCQKKVWYRAPVFSYCVQWEHDSAMVNLQKHPTCHAHQPSVCMALVLWKH